MDLGFPHPWADKDTATVIFAGIALATTWAALQLQDMGDARRAVLNAPEPAYVGEDNTTRQERLAELRAERRGAAARGDLFKRLSKALFTVSVFCGIVSSLPWLAGAGAAGIALIIAYAIREYRREPRAVGTRLAILNLVREIRACNLNTPYMFDTQIYADIEAVFATPTDQLDTLEQTLRIALIEARKAYKTYVARNRARAQQPSPPEDGGEPPDEAAPGGS